jgi:hypothetical protein
VVPRNLASIRARGQRQPLLRDPASVTIRHRERGEAISERPLHPQHQPLESPNSV